ncbi:disease resistance protein L6-like isoform X4 [Syzygium oleosum]|uniref:disease resistance protein L6-like isoform X4 n=1 Tax=Syzygium oleosum TaxID=219896 RepID=UPI0024BAFB74|nr:disease resistance protein L6-like isoform X4 [Syzygium oleosum]
MANSDAGTSSSNARGAEYQVFLNFRGGDTRFGFTSFLHQDLVRNSIRAFIDEEELRVGEEIGGELLQAIDNSQIYIPIFSRNYADSKWCLRELARMVDNTSKSKEKKILPIFYDVEPDDVDLKTPVYRTAIDEHKKKLPRHKVESWEEALKKVDKIKGWVLPKCKSQAELVDLVVKEVLHGLKRKHKFVTKDLVGLDDRVAKVLELLGVDCSDEVRLVGLHGMGGIGKTTLARLIYNELSSRFGKCCAFLDDVREMSKKEGLVWLQKKLLTEIDSSSAAEIISGVDHGRETIEATLVSKKVLIILDDVDEKEQIENLMGQGRLHPGTRIIITTRNTSVLKIIRQRMARQMKEKNSGHALQILPYEMKEMNFDHALQLFKRHAFLEGPLAEDFDHLSRDIVSTTGGLPLALEVIGSLLCGESKARWEKSLDKLKDIPHEDVQKKLMISYDALNDYQREIFLDVACFLINADITNANYMWEACEFHPEIEDLVRMSLIKIKDNNKFWMHDQLRDLGREIVRRESRQNLGEQSRLWTSEEVLDFITTDKRKKKVKAIDLRQSNSHISIRNEEIERFESLAFLRLSNGTFLGDSIIRLPELRWMSWSSPLPDCSVASMHSKNLVVLELFDNHFTDDSKVWDLIKMATKLKSLSLVDCHRITRTPDLSKCLTLERLTFDYCWELREINNSIGKLTCLRDLNITNCKLVERVPDEIGGLVKLERFSLQRCYKVRGLPTSIGKLASLRKLDLSNTRITSLPDSIGKLRCLSDLNLQRLAITEIPDEIEGLVELRHLCLEGTMIKQLPDSIGKLKSLCTLNLSHYTYEESNSNRWKLPKDIGMLDKLEELDFGHRRELVGEIPYEIGNLSSLRVLNLCNTSISGVSGTINKLSHLSTLDLKGCHEITELPELPTSLVRLYILSYSLKVIPNLSRLTNLVELVLSDCFYNRKSSNIMHTCDLGWIGGLSKLKKLDLTLLNVVVPPTRLGPLSLLEDLDLCGLHPHPLEQPRPSLLPLELDNFSSTGSPLSNLKILSILTRGFSRLQEIQFNGLLQLRHLRLHECSLQSLSIPSSLTQLGLYDCPNLIEIQFLGMSASLEDLYIGDCGSIERIVFCGEVGSLGVLDQSESSSSESTYFAPGVLLLPNALKKLKTLIVVRCKNLLEIQVIELSNSKNLHYLEIHECSKLRVVKGVNELEFLTELVVYDCPSLETLLDISNLKIPDNCRILVRGCRESLNTLSRGTFIPFRHYKRTAQQGAPQPETNKEEAKMEGDAKEPNELQLQLHPSASSRDHEISEEPPIDNVGERTLPRNQNQTTEQDLNPLSLDERGKQNQTTEQDSNSLSLDKPGKQNQTTEQDSNPLSLDELAPPRTFCDRFKTCLVSILECICNRDLS